MAADAEQIGAERPRLYFQLAERLNGVRVAQCLAVFSFYGGKYLPHRHHRARLIIDEHHGHQRGGGVRLGGDILGMDHAVAARQNPRHGKALVFQLLARFEHAAVLHGGNDDLAADALGRVCRAEQREVVRLGAAAREGDLLLRDMQTRRDRLARRRQLMLRLHALGVERGGVAEGRCHDRIRLVRRRF